MKRVLLKLSGEALAGDKKTGFDEATCMGNRWRKLLERKKQRDHRPDKSRSDRYACNCYELYLCI